MELLDIDTPAHQADSGRWVSAGKKTNDSLRLLSLANVRSINEMTRVFLLEET